MNCCEGCLKSEREALLSLNAQFDFPLFWEDNIDCCDWERVLCNITTKRVVELHLEGVMDYNQPRNWYINVSDFIAFEDLKYLDLSSNSIGYFVEYKGSKILTKLEVLHLEDNRIRENVFGKSTMGPFSSISELYLRDNQLNGATGFFNLSNLEILDLSYNNITNFVGHEGTKSVTKLKVLQLEGNWIDENILRKSSIQHFANISELFLSDNQIHGAIVAAGLLSFNNLEILDLSYNNITNFVIDEGSKSLTKLKVLRLDGNRMDQNMLKKSTIQLFANISELYLHSNQLNGACVTTGLLSLTNLEVLDLSYNNITNFVVDEGSKSLTKLKVLRLDGNRMDENMLGKSTIQLFVYIGELSVSYNQLNGAVVATGLLSLNNLEILDLSYNNITNFIVDEGSKSLTKLKVLKLDGNRMTGIMLRTTILQFSSLSELSLSYNQFSGAIVARDFCDLTNLKYLSLDQSTNLENEFLKSIGLLTSLKVLSLGGCGFTGILPAAEWYKLKKLEVLDLSDNKFEGSLPSSFCNMTSLRVLQLEGSNNFVGSFSSNLASFTSLENIDFEGNHFEFPISLTPFSNNSNIKYINGNGNKLILDSPLTLQTWVPKFQLDTLSLSSSTMTESFPLPNFLLYQNQLRYLDLSSVKLEVGFPSWLIENNTGIIGLVLSNCSLSGPFQLQLNRFSNMETMGRISSNISSLRYLDISNNDFVGELPNGWSKSFPFLAEIVLSNNKFEGSIPLDFTELENMVHLDLSENKLSGLVPSFLTHVPKFIQLNNNEFSSLPKRIFNEGSSVVMLDLSNNHIRSGIQDMIQDLTNHSGLIFLLLGGNYFTGKIPKELCLLRNISILDLSHNNFYGPIPNCLGKLPFENNPNTVEDILFSTTFFVGFLGRVELTFTTKKSSYIYTKIILAYMTGIDLSHNNLGGNIPYELGNLTKIRAMNLSYNNLKGKIPTTFSKLAQIESLDLSFNKLYGNVPPEMNILSSLEVFSVAHNNLSGSLPEWKEQFLTFNESSFEGNPFLCGPPLQSCNPFTLPNGSYTEDDYDDSVEMYIFWVSFGVSFTSALLVIAIILYINPYWRRVWFYYIELIITNCYYFIEDHVCKFPFNI